MLKKHKTAAHERGQIKVLHKTFGTMMKSVKVIYGSFIFHINHGSSLFLYRNG